MAAPGVTKPRCKVILDVIYDERVMDGIFKDTVYRLEGPKVNGCPMTCTVEKNDYMSADTCKVELSKSFFNGDISDDMFRSVEIWIYMDTAATVQDTFIASDDNLVFVGFVDQVKVKQHEGVATMYLEARDYTGLLLSRKFAGDALGELKKNAVDKNKTVDQIIRGILDEHGQTESIQIKKIPDSLTLPLFKNVVEPQKSEQETTKQDHSLWQVITNLVRQLGLIAYIDNTDLIISEARYLYSRQSDQQASIPVYEFGYNVKETQFEKQLGIKDIPIVDVRSYDPANKEVLIAQFPPESYLKAGEHAQVKAGVNPGQQTDYTDLFQSAGYTPGDIAALAEDKDRKAITFIMQGITSQTNLDKIAENLWISASKHQTQGRVTTKRNLVDTIDGDQYRTQDLKNGDLIFVRKSDPSIDAKINFDGDTKEPSPRKKDYNIGRAQGLPYFILGNTIEFTFDNGFMYTIQCGAFIDYERMLKQDTSSRETIKERSQKTAGDSKLDDTPTFEVAVTPVRLPVYPYITVVPTLRAGKSSKLPESHR